MNVIFGNLLPFMYGHFAVRYLDRKEETSDMGSDL